MEKILQKEGRVARSSRFLLQVFKLNRAKWTLRQAHQLEKTGNALEAARRYDEIALFDHALGHSEESVAAAENEAERLRSTLPLESDGSNWKGTIGNLSKSEAAILQDLETSTRRVGRFTIVPADVKQFVRSLEIGVRNPEVYFEDLRKTKPELVDIWHSVPREKRIFVIGSGEDKDLISLWSQELESSGYKMFFYQFCQTRNGGLCRPEAVGAYLGTAGHAVLADGSAAIRSRFVTHETAAARMLLGHGSHLIMFSPEEVWNAWKNKKNHIGVVGVSLLANPDSAVGAGDIGGTWFGFGLGTGGFCCSLLALRRLARTAIARLNPSSHGQIGETRDTRYSRDLYPRRLPFAIALTFFSTVGFTSLITAEGRPELELSALGGLGLSAWFILSLLPRSTRLHLTSEGFAICRAFAWEPIVHWSSVSSFQVKQIGESKQRAVVYVTQHKPASWIGRFAQRFVSGEKSLGAWAHLTPEALCELMNFWKSQAQSQKTRAPL